VTHAGVLPVLANRAELLENTLVREHIS